MFVFEQVNKFETVYQCTSKLLGLNNVVFQIKSEKSIFM